MELEKNMYVRTKAGMIAKIVSKEDVSGSLHREEIVFILDNGNKLALHSKKVSKASYNIIDLIECLDIVELYISGLEEDNITQIIRPETLNELKELKKHIKNGAKIKSITTRKMFENMNYKVGE